MTLRAWDRARGGVPSPNHQLALDQRSGVPVAGRREPALGLARLPDHLRSQAEGAQEREKFARRRVERRGGGTKGMRASGVRVSLRRAMCAPPQVGTLRAIGAPPRQAAALRNSSKREAMRAEPEPGAHGRACEMPHLRQVEAEQVIEDVLGSALALAPPSKQHEDVVDGGRGVPCARDGALAEGDARTLPHQRLCAAMCESARPRRSARQGSEEVPVRL
jgi:hypothetical protein